MAVCCALWDGSDRLIMSVWEGVSEAGAHAAASRPLSLCSCLRCCVGSIVAVVVVVVVVVVFVVVFSDTSCCGMLCCAAWGCRTPEAITEVACTGGTGNEARWIKVDSSEGEMHVGHPLQRRCLAPKKYRGAFHRDVAAQKWKLEAKVAIFTSTSRVKIQSCTNDDLTSARRRLRVTVVTQVLALAHNAGSSHSEPCALGSKPLEHTNA